MILSSSFASLSINYDARPARLSLVVMCPWFYQYQSCKWITEQYVFALFNSPIQVVCTPPQEDTSRQVTVESLPPPVSTSTAQSTAEGLCQREESSSDSEKEKPIWRPKLKRKRKKNNHQGWWFYHSGAAVDYWIKYMKRSPYRIFPCDSAGNGVNQDGHEGLDWVRSQDRCKCYTAFEHY